MEEKINIAKILKNKPEGTKLWTDMFGSVTLYVVTYACDAFQVKHHNKDTWFDEDGKLYKEGVLCIYPSKSMRDWEKLSWKKGDVLKNTAYEERVIFDGFLNDDYTYFKGKHPLDCSDKFKISYHEECNCFTGNYRLESTDAANTYIKTIEERLGGKLNIETLEIEKIQPEFKDGDIVSAVFTDGDEIVCVFKEKIEQDYMGYCGFFSKGKHKGDVIMDLGDDCICNDSPICKEIRLATEEEKQQLFSALEKEGKRWDSDKKKVVDLKPKVELKPFDKVLVRCSKADRWSIDFFSYKVHNGYICTGDDWFGYCLPYNEETAKLIGTTNNVEG